MSVSSPKTSEVVTASAQSSVSKRGNNEHKAPKGGKLTAKAITRRNTVHGIGFIFLILVPVLMLFYIANTKWSAFGDPKWTGLLNWKRLFKDDVFNAAFVNTIVYSVVHIPLTLGIAFALAVLLNSKLKFRSFFRTVAFFPYITSIVAAAQVWNMLFDAKSGVINQFLGLFTDNPPAWLGSTTWAMPAVIIVATWREVGYYMILLLAGLQTIPTELYEASSIDGANGWKQFWKITVPCMRPTLFFVLVTLTIGSFKILDLTLVMTNGGPGTSTLVLAQYVYRVAFERSDYGYASTVSLTLFALCMVVTLIQFWYNNRKEK